MAKADLRIDFERANRVFQPGDTVRGQVVVSVDAPCRCDGLTFAYQWRTHGKGNEDAGEITVATLFQGQWAEGDEYGYPFEFTAPRGPVTYHGHHINVDWYVNVRADIPWALDPKIEEDFLLERGDFTEEIGQPLMGVASSLAAGTGADGLQPARSNLPLVIGLILLVVPWLVSWFAFDLGRVFYDFSFDSVPRVIGLLIPVLVPAVISFWGGKLVYRSWQNKAAERKLGPAHFSIEAADIHRGETLNASFAFSPNEDVRVSAITLRLCATERAVSGSGTNTSTHSHRVYEQSYALLEDEHVAKDSAWSRTVELTVPSDAPPSFGAGSNRLQWEAELVVDLPRWPDWVRRQPLRVLP